MNLENVIEALKELKIECEYSEGCEGCPLQEACERETGRRHLNTKFYLCTFAFEALEDIRDWRNENEE